MSKIGQWGFELTDMYQELDTSLVGEPFDEDELFTCDDLSQQAIRKVNELCDRLENTLGGIRK